MNFKYPPRFLPLVSSIKSAPISTASKDPIGWSALVLGKNGRPIGSGTACARELATRIAVAESIEWLEREAGFSIEERKTLRCDDYPTRCGFAAGFEREPTRMRANAEAVERWLWSKWIDSGFFIQETGRPNFSALGAHYAGQFDQVLYFEKIVEHNMPGIPASLRLGAVLAIRDGGAFPGSRVCSLNEDPWEHAVIEAWRHYNIFKNLRDRPDIYPILSQRLKYFGTNQAAAVTAVLQGRNKDWPTPEIELAIELRHPRIDGYSLFRVISKDYIPWHTGDYKRFIF